MAMQRPDEDVFASDIVESVHFTFYRAEEMRRMSVKKVTKPDTFDVKYLPVPDGLYDPAMGPIYQTDLCKTCGQPWAKCSGHFGHIELAQTVFHPLMFGGLQALIQITCLQCHKFRTNSEFDFSDAFFKGFGTPWLKASMPSLSASFLNQRVENCSSWLELIIEGDIVGATKLQESICDFSDKSSANFEFAKKSTWTSIQYKEAHRIINLLLKKTKKKCSHCGYRNPRVTSPIFGWLNKVMKTKDARANVIGSADISEKKSMQDEVDIEGPGKEHLLPIEVENILKDLWENEPRFCHLICDLQQSTLTMAERETGYEMFFLKVVPVSPNRFRPSSGGPDSDIGILEHPHNELLSRVVETNNLFRRQLAANANSSEIVKCWIDLQNCVTLLFDSSKAIGRAGKGLSGIRQILEKKGGMVRKHMMGKRVNFACRSVISPDPYLAVNEIGIPPYFAMNLTYPERVTAWNVNELQLAVLNGANVHPGATHYRDNTGFHMLPRTSAKRNAVARKLPTSRAYAKLGKGPEANCESKVVYRHLKDGDVVLVNRQPTLHKSSMMAHVVRVLKGEKTMRMHYANCSSYNADFDGDEINVHVPQDEISRAEAMNIVNANKQYNVTTSGDPIRGLIQDHIVSAVLLTNLDTFLTREEYDQLLYGSVLPNYAPNTLLGKTRCHKISVIESFDEIQPLPPAIMKPKPLWTGKQVITAILNYITRGQPPFTIERKGRIPKEYIQDNKGKKSSKHKTSREEPPEGALYIHDNELVKGMIDKAQFGKFGIVHTVHELYGADAAGDLLSMFSRLFTIFLQMHGFTCGVDDLLIDHYSDCKRRKMLEKCEEDSEDVHARFTGIKDNNTDPLVQGELEKVVRRHGDLATVTLDRMMCNALNIRTSEVNNILFPNGLQKPYPNNCLSLMTTTGAKGSLVNMTQISSLLGQQELDGKRVPRMVSGKTLPCFPAWDASSRSGGFISDRFLTGLRPQEYYFHCMAGRDGLVDTAVKTSRSGYLQRSLIKNLESLKVSYDFTVRDVDGSVIQFQYGEDGVDVHKTSFLSNFRILSDNRKALLDKFGDHAQSSELLQSNDYIKDLPSPLSDQAKKFAKLPKNKQKCRHKIKRKELINLTRLKYLTSLADPGESVGVLAAQSIGEPSTQMTLNTFHLAGRGDINVTLGIPRLQEILMTASKQIRAPLMKCPLLPSTSMEEAEQVAAKLRRICVADVIETIEVCKIPFFVKNKRVFTIYKLKMRLFPSESFPPYCDLTPDECLEIISDVFVDAMEDAIQKHLALLNRIKNIKVAKGQKNMEAGGVDNETDGEGEEEGMDDEDSDGEGADAEKRRRQERDEVEYEDELDTKVPNKKEKINEEDEDEDDDNVEEKEEDYMMEKIKTEPDEEEHEETDEMKKDGKENKKKKKKDEKVVKEKKESKEKKKIIHKESNGLDFELHFRFEQDDPHVLLAEIAQRTAKCVYIRSCRNIELCSVVNSENKNSPPTLQTAGVNFDAFWALGEYLDINKLTTNDIEKMRTIYGVEAARATILQEVSKVFKAYGIGVNKRHLSLVADFMTCDGGYRPMNRSGMSDYSTSPFGKMAFEMATKFIVGSAYHGEVERIESPSASVCLGQPMKMGTGVFDLFHRFSTAS